MSQPSYLQILSPEQGRAYASFFVYLPSGRGENEYVQYRFLYEENPPTPTLGFSEGANDPSNRAFYRIREAYVGSLNGACFTPSFRVLQSGEIGLAFREEGAGDFVGGVHGDEVLISVRLCADGEELSLTTPDFRSFSQLEFWEDSHIFRCNTPDERLVLHRQHYTVTGDIIRLGQSVEWLVDGCTLHAAYMPMLTIQRLNPANPEQILTDTVEFYDRRGGELLTRFDTTPYGTGNPGQYATNACENTPATAVRVYGRESGLVAETGYTVLEESIPTEQIKSFLCIRYKKLLDNKIYFGIGCRHPQKGSVWKSDVYYRITFEGEL